jgi:hypothetical protein
MKYGESAFCILYLIFAIASGCVILRRAKDRTGRMMGLAALILGCGDAFHLVPRVLNHFISGDFTAALGIGKLVTSVTMTVFYVLLFYVWKGIYGVNEKKQDRSCPLRTGGPAHCTVPASPERLAAEQQRHDLGNHTKHPVRYARGCGLHFVLPQEK